MPSVEDEFIEGDRPYFYEAVCKGDAEDIPYKQPSTDFSKKQK